MWYTLCPSADSKEVIDMFEKRIPLLVVIACIVMGVVDAVIQPGYAVKSAIKIVMFMLIPVIYGIANKKQANIQKLFKA